PRARRAKTGEQGVEGRGLGPGRPPRHDLELLRALGFGGGGAAAGAERERESSNGGGRDHGPLSGHAAPPAGCAGPGRVAGPASGTGSPPVTLGSVLRSYSA